MCRIVSLLSSFIFSLSALLSVIVFVVLLYLRPGRSVRFVVQYWNLRTTMYFSLFFLECEARKLNRTAIPYEKVTIL